jgi:hypothetical protein
VTHQNAVLKTDYRMAITALVRSTLLRIEGDYGFWRKYTGYSDHSFSGATMKVFNGDYNRRFTDTRLAWETYAHGRSGS